MKGTFCMYSIMRHIVYHIEKYSSEKIFNENNIPDLCTNVEKTFFERYSRSLGRYLEIVHSASFVF